ncbi:flagellar assembly peptidoglycan hydrolase FlgJ [Crenobacter cavernae]|uniref:Peptidoglycan hydrolase FlgJ n=1 Tax=Crenobacter cavernae TaxID=2290923 RepID=A0ABY0FDH7_9NEIS|nr:flagellar assembly peptidoglycan hydrolase FlgJ [Crenobacter cavernae]RXZ44237.1 flagellar assembly peptidoglycan hydrolase FlgJ [Crenobacter cavernae]
MNPLSNTASSADVVKRLAVDPTGLETLRARAAQDPKGTVKEAARQFEALFMDNLMKAMRATSFDDEEDSPEMDTFKGMLDQQLVQTLSKAGGMGLADVLTRQLSKLSKSDEPLTPETRQFASTESVLPQVKKALAAYGAKWAEAQANPAARAAELAGDAGKTLPAAPQNFVETLLPHARRAAESLGVAPQLVVAHAALETGWGRRAIRNADGSDSHNLFGIKAGGAWKGDTVDVLTTEYVGGVPQKRVETFRSYPSYAAAFDDYARLLADNPRYRGALGQGGNAGGFAQGLQQGGYATDPRYAKKLADVAGGLIARGI